VRASASLDDLRHRIDAYLLLPPYPVLSNENHGACRCRAITVRLLSDQTASDREIDFRITISAGGKRSVRDKDFVLWTDQPGLRS
jgi:hypothetical protein